MEIKSNVDYDHADPHPKVASFVQAFKYTIFYLDVCIGYKDS